MAITYTTVADLESYAATNYGNVDVGYTDAVVESNISQAERYINVYTRQKFTGTIPDAVVAVTLELSRRLMHNISVNDGYLTNIEKGALKLYEIVIDDNMKQMLSMYIKADAEEGSIDIIPLERTPNSWGY